MVVSEALGAAYGQAGIIGLRRRIGFVDGAASVTRPIASWGDTEILSGAGVWGAAQPGLARLNLGPRAEARVPIAGERVRLSLEWRQRIAGNRFHSARRYIEEHHARLGQIAKGANAASCFDRSAERLQVTNQCVGNALGSTTGYRPIGCVSRQRENEAKRCRGSAVERQE